MNKKDFLQEKYCEINHLKNLLETYPKEYCETIISVMNKVFEEISDYLESEKKKLKIKDKKKEKECKKHSRRENFTLEQLAKFNGKDGNPAYVAVNGIVYDVTNIKAWKNGNHYGLIAGVDLSRQYPNCHADNLKILERAEVVGELNNLTNRADIQYYRIEEIAQYNGKNGNPAYVVIGGMVYDVSDVKGWNDGKHYGLLAGKDLSEYFKVCHKDEVEVLKKLRVVGKIVE